MAKKVAEKTTNKFGAGVMPCSCSHEYQDSVYGKGRRVHTICRGGTKFRCTVCGSER